MLTEQQQHMQNSSMPVSITIRNVPEEVRNELAARAAKSGKSLQEYLRGELIGMTDKPDLETWLEKVQARKEATGEGVTMEQILEALEDHHDRP